MEMRKVMGTTAAIFLVLGLAAAASSSNAGPPADKGKSGKSKSGADTSTSLSIAVTAGISAGEARQLAAQYGLIGAKPVPPGIRKNLARGKPMPPGIQKTRLPGPFLDSLPRHEGYQWQQAGSDLVLVMSGSLVITDILQGVFD